MTDREMERRHLALADRHLAEGADRIAKQEALIADLNRDGHDTTEASHLLSLLRDVQKESAKHRRLILEALNEPEDGATAG